MIINPYRFGSPLLLDTYTGATAAYSLRKLRTAYTGYCIEVRRSSDDTTLNIGFTALGVLDESALTTFVGAGNDGFVKTWYDQSGSNNASQGTAGNQPKIVASGTIITDNGKPSLLNSHTNDKLNISTIPSSVVQPISSFIVCNATQDVSEIHGGTNRISAIINQNSVQLYSGAWGGSTLNQGYGQHLYFLLFNGTNSACSFDGGEKSTSDAGTNGLYNNIFAICGYHGNGDPGTFANGYTQEIIIWASDKSSDKSAIETNINSFYSIY
jgi:hypothetical protein